MGTQQAVITDQTVISVTPDQVASELAGEVVILNLKSGVYFGLNEVGAFVWNLIQQPIRVADLRQAMLEEYEVAFEQCDADMKALLQNLTDNQLIQLSDEIPN